MTFPADPTPQPIDPTRADALNPLAENPSASDQWDLDEDPQNAPGEAPAKLTPQPATARPQAAAAPVANSPLPSQHPSAPRFSRAEKLSLAIFVALLLVAAVWMLRMLADNVPVSTATAVRFPVAGSLTTLTNVESFWRRPVTTGPSPDRFRLGARLLPVARITLDPSSASGALRIFFRNPAGESVGDPTTLAFANGRFSATGTPVADITATDGFHEDGMHAAYLAGQSAPWMLDLREAASTNAPADEFTPLLQLPISPERR